ncbi:MAG: sulfite reductase (NADPH) hemoprotein beta-component, partial [Candidatus Omnitrophota bacterium]
MKKPFEPNFNTPKEDFTKEEINKLNKEVVFTQMSNEMRDDSNTDVAWEVEQIAKSFGFYLEFDRGIKGEKNWMYMIRIANPSGGPLSREQYIAYDQLSEKHGIKPNKIPTLRATTRQTFQFHWINKEGVIDICKSMAEVGQSSLNG